MGKHLRKWESTYEEINYNLFKNDIIVGSCLLQAAHIDVLKEAGVSLVICLQQDTDMASCGVNIEAIQGRAREVDVRHVRMPIIDMDLIDLRLRLPDVISQMHKEVKQAGPGLIYVHCTAGMGRAPAVALAYMWWVHGLPLDPTFAELREKRGCYTPSLSAVRKAAVDILYGGTPQEVANQERSSRFEVLLDGTGDEAHAARQRVLTRGGVLTDAELKHIRNQLELH